MKKEKKELPVSDKVAQKIGCTIFLVIGLGLLAIVIYVAFNMDSSDEITKENIEKRENKAEKKEKEKAEKKAKKENKDEIELSENNIPEVNNVYLEIADEYGGDLIIKIEPKTDDYKEVNVMLNEGVYNLYDDNDKQILIDDIGNKVEGNTRSRLYGGTPSSKFIKVYFVNQKFELIAKTGVFDRGWKVK